jgi:hypothetical protein
MKPLDLRKARSVALSTRDSSYSCEDFCRPKPLPDVRALEASWPRILKGRELSEFLDLWAAAARRKKSCLFLFGAHVVKCGLGPLLIRLSEEGAVSMLSTHGAGALHDIEVALNGATSEDVDANLKNGSFGMARDTAELFFEAVRRAQAEDLGLGRALALTLWSRRPKYAASSFLCHAAQADLPVTVHAAIGTDTLAEHADFPAAELGAATYRDFLTLAAAVVGLHQGGVVVNCGSAVILPEVFLKALASARNVSGPVTHFTTANFDMIQHYRPNQNVVRRPTLEGGRGFSFTGHHELLLPLVGWALLGRLGQSQEPVTHP